MQTHQVAVRFSPELAERIRKEAALRGMTPPSVIQACVDFYLPVIEAGLHGSPFAEPMIQQWRDDLRQATEHLKTLPAPARAKRKAA